MTKLNKSQLLQEAKQQTKAIATLKRWMGCLFLIANLAMVLGMWGIAGSSGRFVAGVVGIILAVLFWTLCGIVGYGIFKGSRNVQNLKTAANVQEI